MWQRAFAGRCAEQGADHFRYKAVGESPLLLAISVRLAPRDAVAGIAGTRLLPKLDTPATPEAILTAIEDIRVRDQTTRSHPASV
jgi:xanthine dehydrogenase large subunit